LFSFLEEPIPLFVRIVIKVTELESIGESLKTMFSRLENIKLGKMFEDDPTNINDVEKALSLVNIKIRDTATSFRPMGDVFDEIASKWATMNQLEQSAVATSIAGKMNARTYSDIWGAISPRR
jgi:TP901 family phage tail tape measure protein